MDTFDFMEHVQFNKTILTVPLNNNCSILWNMSNNKKHISYIKI